MFVCLFVCLFSAGFRSHVLTIKSSMCQRDRKTHLMISQTQSASRYRFGFDHVFTRPFIYQFSQFGYSVSHIRQSQSIGQSVSQSDISTFIAHPSIQSPLGIRPSIHSEVRHRQRPSMHPYTQSESQVFTIHSCSQSECQVFTHHPFYETVDQFRISPSFHRVSEMFALPS